LKGIGKYNPKKPGPIGIPRYVKKTTPKSLLTNQEKQQEYLVGKQLNYSVATFGDSWVFTFNFSRIMHQISLHLESKASPTQPLVNELTLIAVVALFSTVFSY
jgi:hypothetical protein